MRHLTLRNGWYIYNRRVPNYLKMFDSRQRVRISLNTKCETTAMKKLTVINDEVESYWKTLIERHETHSKKKFKELVTIAKQLGFTYVPSSKLLDFPMNECLACIFSANHFIDTSKLTDAVLGSDDRQDTLLSNALDAFWDYSKPTLMRKNLDQQRKWKNSRKKAVKNFINQVGDKNICEISNIDLVKFRDWWLERIDKESLKTNTANKDFTSLRNVIDTVSTHEQLEIDVSKLFKKIHFDEYDSETRNSYSSSFIQNNILNKKKLISLDKAGNILCTHQLKQAQDQLN